MVRSVALITGCSDGGIGHALCVELARRPNWHVYASARRLESLVGLAELGCTCLVLDVTNESSVKAAVDTAAKETGTIDLLVNNAGLGCFGPVAEVDVAAAKTCFDANFWGCITVIQAVAPIMAKAKRGTIANIASIVGMVSTPFGGIYCASKAALVSLSDALRMELAPFNVKVVIVNPGAIRSKFGANAVGGSDAQINSRKLYKPFSASIKARASSSQRAKSTPASVFAKTVVAELVKPSPKVIVWCGHFSLLFRFLAAFVPRWLRDIPLMRMFGLNKKTASSGEL